MKTCWHRLALGILAFACNSAAPQERPWAPEELYERLSPSVWLVETQHMDDTAAIGSAVVVAPGTLVTNCHVVDKARSIMVSHAHRARVRVNAVLQYRDPTRDLCQLQAPVLAPSVQTAPADSLRPGAKVYAIGNPRGLDLTISDGLISGLRRNEAGELQLVQISVPISPGSSGGGLFDGRGRLIGITTSGLRDSQNINFALPAEWIAELGPRARGDTVTRRAPAKVPQPPTALPAPLPSPEAPPVAIAQPPATKDGVRIFEYQLRDRLTGAVRPVLFRVDRREGDRLVINGGSRIEQADGRVIADSGLIAGEFDAAMPPGGWVHQGNMREKSWRSTYQSAGDGRPFRMEISAELLGEEVLMVKGRRLQTYRVRYTGYTSRGGGPANNPPGAYTATAWYAPEISRVVRFEARSRGGLGHTAFMVDEVLELVDVRAE